jgi:PAS domain S-box-containing protein
METAPILFREVLLVEDEAPHALLVQRALRGVVAQIETCTTVASALALLATRRFDLVLSDLNLPDMQRDGAVAAIRGSAPRVPLVVLTSSATVADGVAAMRAGANDFLVKNFDATFRDVLHLALSRLRSALDAEQERAQIVRDRDLLREAVENSNDGLAVVHRDGRVRYCNSAFDAFLETFGLVGRNVLDLPASAIERGEEVVSKVRERFAYLEPGAVWATEVVGEGDVAFDLSVSAAKDAGDEALLVVWVRDIRERKRREQLQRDILSTTTHDLKGPLGAISVSCDVLLDKPAADDRTHALVERIAASASSAIHLIDEFLSVRRLEEGGFVMRPYSQDLLPIMRKVVDSYGLSAKTRGIELSISEGGEELLGCVDGLGFERVLFNLVSNAIKFTPKGGRVQIGVERVAGGTVLQVTDSGSGMEPSDAQRLFSRYARLAQHSGVSGTGLGLFIVKCIVSAHGGSIDVTSALGRGTTFEVFLPDAPPINERGEVLCLDFA